jgi:DNA repair exonuclease SbcCD nuclease subunit
MGKIREKTYDFLFFADLQLGERKDLNVPTKSGLNSRLLEGIDIVNQVGELGRKYQVKRIFLLGDVFELKDRIPARIMILFAEAVAKYPCPLTILRGNHDFAEDEYAPIRLLEREGKIDFISNPWVDFSKTSTSNGIAFLPYFRKWNQFVEEWKRLHFLIEGHSEPTKLFLFHNTVPGSKFANNRKAEGEFDLPTIKNVRYLAGDIHLPQKVGPIQYLGSPYQVDFGEEGQDKFVYLYKTEGDILTPVELKYPKFISVDVSTINDIEQKDIEGNYVRMIGEVLKEKKEQVEECKKILESWNPKFVVSAVKYRTEKKTRIDVAKSDHQAVLSEFLQQSETGLDKKRLLEVGLDLIKEVQT